MRKNKVALVTGGSRGLGKNMALKLAEKGLDVILTYHSNRDKAEDVIRQIETKGQKAVAFQLDTEDIHQFDDFIQRIKAYLSEDQENPKFDFLINNAGTGLHATIEETQEDQFDRLVNIHYKGVFFLTQKLTPYLNSGGGIVNISSGLARFSLPSTAAYASLKGAVEVLTRIQAVEFGPRQIRANVVAPGAIETDFNGGAIRDNEQLNQMVSSMTALGRVGLPEDIGGVVAFLCTEDAQWINGQRIEVSGGMRL